MMKGVIIALFLLTSLLANATDADSLRVESLLSKVGQSGESSGSERMLFFAKQLLDVPYVAGTLEGNKREQLVVNLRELDCTTFVECVVALTLTSANEDPSFTTYKRVLQGLRYRNGQIDGYLSRLHYFSDWVMQNEQRGVWQELTPNYSDVHFPIKFSFMSQHRNSYPILKDSCELIDQIIDIERALSRHPLYYIPKEHLQNKQSLHWVQEGDIIAITTPIEGLDVVHLGIAIRVEGEMRLLHASSVAKRVVVDRRSLADQVSHYKSQSGIRVVRIN